VPTTTYLTTAIDTSSADQEFSVATSSITPNANRLLVALLMVENAPGMTDPTGSGNGLTWVLSGTDVSVSAQQFYCLTAPTGSSPSAGAFTATWTSDPGNNYNLSVWEIDGADLVAPIRSDAVVGNANPGNPFCTFAGTVSGSSILAICRRYNNSTDIVPPSGYTEDSEGNVGGGVNRGYEVCHKDSESAITTLTWGASNADTLAWAVEVAAETLGPAGSWVVV
jgi:hypothetical protein